MKRVIQSILICTLVFELAFNPNQVIGKNNEEKGKKADPTPAVEQSGKDAGDNRHPSGKDRSVEPGKSGTQGKAKSDPDGNSNANGGDAKDKIGNTGGFDKADQDGNNGCGNDDDFEDDNNGKCLGKSANRLAVVIDPTHTPKPKIKPTIAPTVAPTASPTATPTSTTSPTNNGSNLNPQVLGMSLPDTGMTEQRIGWMFKVVGLMFANLAFIFPPKKWILNAEF